MKISHRRWLYNHTLATFPSGRMMGIKRIILKWAGISLGQNASLEDGVTFVGDGEIAIGANFVARGNVRMEAWGDGRIVIGDNCEINHETYISGNGNSVIKIGNNVRIAHMVSLKASAHEIDLTGPCIAGRTTFRDIRIGDGSWICAGVIVIPGVNIGAKSVVAAGAVVVADVPDCVLVAGVPALVKKKY